MDRLTGLMWCRNANLAEFPLTWQEALDFVATMNREQNFGLRDWRLPNRRELRSLLSLQTRLPALPERHPFINVFNGWYWTATTATISPSHAWYVALNGGRMFYGGKDQSFMLWPVRCEGLGVVPRTGQCLCYDAAGKVIACPGSGQDGEWRYGAAWPEPRFEILHDGILDRLTRLLWRRSANLNAQPVIWRAALDAVAELNREGAAICWRLPTINELEVLVDCATHSPALPSGHPFTDVQDIYWSSTTSLLSPFRPGLCTWKKVRPASDKSGMHNFRYGPWQLLSVRVQPPTPVQEQHQRKTGVIGDLCREKRRQTASIPPCCKPWRTRSMGP